MILCVILLITLHLYLFYMRSVKFYQSPSIINKRNDLFKTIYSSVCGRIVYKHIIEINDINRKLRFSNKEGRNLSIPQDLSNGTYFHVGIYMSPYDNHHILGLNSNSYYKHDTFKVIEGNLFSMLSFLDILLPFGWYKNWFQKKLNSFIAYNKRINFYYKDNIITSLIFDRYVNKFSTIYKDNNNRFVIGFIHRGSQMDYFIPYDNFIFRRKVGDKVDYNTELFYKVTDVKLPNKRSIIK